MDLHPLLFQKTGSDFWSHTVSRTPTERETWLIEVLHEQIGVNFSNPDGWYYFNAIMANERLVYSMTPIEPKFAELIHQVLQDRSN